MVDYASSNQTEKHGGVAQELSPDEALTVSQERAPEMVALDDALEELARIDRRKSQIAHQAAAAAKSIYEKLV